MGRPAKRTKLLSDADSDSDGDSNSKTGGVPIAGFKVNEEYARRFEHNKKREEKDRLEEKYGKAAAADTNGIDDIDEEDDDSSSDETEDDDAELATQDLDEEIMATLNAIRSKDPRVYNKDVKFYKEFEPEAMEVKKEKEEKPMYLQDYHRQNLLAGHVGGDDEDDGMEVPLTYNQEQEAMKRELVDSMHNAANGVKDEADEEEEEFMVAKARPKHDSLPTASTQSRQLTDADVAQADKDPETYLSNFMAARAWLPTQTAKWQAFDSDDSEEEKRADMFEEAFNMRFEDPATANERLQSFARDAGKYSVRREEKLGGRQKTREREKQKKEAEKQEREQDRARLRKLRIEEAEQKVKKIKEAAGLGHIDVEEWKDVLEGDFEDEKWEEEMKRRFGEGYYAAKDDEVNEAEDSDEDGGREKRRKRALQKPKWDDDIEIKDLVPEFDDDELNKPTVTLTDDEDDTAMPDANEDDQDDDDDDDGQNSIRKSKKTTKKDRTAAKAAAKTAARRERRKIEDMIDANLPIATATAGSASGPVFRYRETSPTTFGLTARDILFADDAQLNQYAGLKKLTAWREPEKKKRDKKRFSKKQRLREWRKDVWGDINGPPENLAEMPAGGEEKKKKKRKRSGKAGVKASEV